MVWSLKFEVPVLRMRGLLFDLDGVIYNAEEPITGAAETVAWVQQEGIPHLFVTNTSSRGRRALVDKLKNFGIHTDLNSILSPCSAAAEWLKEKGKGAVALFIKPEAFEEFEGLELLPDNAQSGARHVVIGDLSEAWDFTKLNRAFRLLHSDPEASLVALGMTRYWNAADGLRLDVAPFIAALECATGRKAIVFGKPSESFYRAAAKQLQLPADEIAMVGDGIDTDVSGAQNAGMKGILVRTGKFRPLDLEGAIHPDAVLDSIRDLPTWIKRV
jgi:phospholysine phosphohistidine inorganic pyrophosphate phosphatase